MTNSRQHNLDYYIGKPVWIKIGILDEDGNEVCRYAYMKILNKSISHGKYVYDVAEIPANYIDNTRKTVKDHLNYWGIDSTYQLADSLMYSNFYFEDEILVYEPMEMITDDDIEELKDYIRGITPY